MAAVDVIPVEVAAAPPTRPRVLLIGTALAAAACAMAFAGLIGIYLSSRSSRARRGHALAARRRDDPAHPGHHGLFTLLLSLVTMQWAVHAVGDNDRRHASWPSRSPSCSASCAINAVTFLFTQSNIGVRDSTMGVLFYVISGAHSP